MAPQRMTGMAAAILIGVSLFGLAHGCTRDEPPTITEPQNLSGVWWTERYDARIQLVGGGDFP